MKADPYGPPAEQARWRANWHTAAKGEGRCDSCQRAEITSGGNGGTTKVHCPWLGCATKPNATCEFHSPIPTPTSIGENIVEDLNHQPAAETGRSGLSPTYDAEPFGTHAEAGANLPAAAPIKFLPAETLGADDERNTRRIVERMGRQKLAAVISKLLTVTDLIELREIKESGIYKGFSHIGEDGKSQPVTTWEEYCRLIEGRSVEAIDLDLKNFETLGAEFFESARRIGIGPGKMRELRKLPPDIQEKAQKAAEQGNKSALLEIIELQAEERRKEREQAAKDKAELERQIANKEADLKASRALSDRTAQQLREHQEAELRRKLGTPNQADRDRVVATLNTSADALKSRVLASFRKECLDVLDAHDGESAEFGRIIVAQALGLIMGAARMVGADLGVVPAADARIAYEQGAYAPGEKAWKLAQAELAAGAEG